MGIFRKPRTFKDVGRGIDLSIQRQKQKEKIVRALEKEKMERDKESALNKKIAELKAEKPSMGKTFAKATAKWSRKAMEYYKRKQQETAKKVKARKRYYYAPVRRPARRYYYAPAKRPVRRTVKRKVAPNAAKPQPYQISGSLGGLA